MDKEYLQKPGPGMSAHTFRREFQLNYPAIDVWNLLLRKDTFTDHQVWPWRVEFAGKNASENMQTGEDNIHHGPFMLFSGVMGEIDSPRYRDLRYYYGSYFLSFRWIRPNRLQIRVEENSPDTCKVTIQIDSWVKPSFSGLWSFLQRIFWSNFGRMVSRLVRRRKSSR